MHFHEAQEQNYLHEGILGVCLVRWCLDLLANQSSDEAQTFVYPFDVLLGTQSFFKV